MPSFRPTCSAAVVLFSLLAAACTEPAGPRDDDQEDRLDVLAVSTTVTDTTFSPLTDQAWVECRVRIDVSPGHPVSGPLELKRIDLAVYTGLDRDTPVDTVIATPNRLNVEFGGRTVDAYGRTSEWDVRADAPFELRGVVQYEDHDGDDGEQPFALTCGPVLDEAATVAPPTVSQLTITPATATIEVGEPVTISYKAASPLGLWETWVVVSHAFGTDTLRRNEGLLRNTTRTLTYANPHGSPLGQRMSIRVIAVDAALRQADIAPVLTPALTDTTPPTLRNAYFVRRSSSHCIPRYCQVPAGSPVWAEVAGYDASGDLTFRVTYDAPVSRTDEVPLVTSSVELPPIETLGIFGASGTLVDAHGNESAPFTLGTINVYAAHGDSLTREIVLPGVAPFAAPDFANALLYVARDSSATLDVVAFDDMGVGSLDLGGVPGGLDVTPDGILVATIPDAHAVELRSAGGALVRSIPITVLPSSAGFRAGSVVRTGEGTLLVALNRGEAWQGGSAVVIEIDTASATQTIVGDSATGTGHYWLSRSGDGSRVILTRSNQQYGGGCARVFDVATEVLGACVQVHYLPSGNETGTRWTTWTNVYDENLTSVMRREIDNRDANTPHPFDTAIEFVIDERGLLRYRIADGVILESRPAPDMIHGGLWISPDGSLAVGAGRPWSDQGNTHVFTVDLD